MQKFSAAMDMLARIVIVAASVAMVALVVITGWMVFGRYVLNDTPTWVERGATLTVVGIALPVAAVGVRERFHLSVLGFRDALPAGIRRAVEIFVDAVVGFFGLAMAWYSIELVETSARIRIPLIGVSMAWTYIPLVICGALIALFSIEQVLLALKRQRTEQHLGASLE